MPHFQDIGQQKQRQTLLQRSYTAVLLISVFLLSSCSSSRPAGELSDIKVLSQGKSIQQKPAMIAACKGFYVSPQKLKDFFKHASLTHEANASNNYKKLPCYSSGDAYIGNEVFHWKLRAGGIGEFHNDNNSFIKICGVSCCNKVQGVC